jgi:cyclomaltodextrinase
MNLIDSHDTPRLRTMCAGDIDGQRLTTLVLLTVGGAPCIYYGDEIGMAGEQDPYSRGAFPADESAWDRDLLAFYRGAIALRNENPALRRGELAIAGAAGMTAAYTRRDGGDAFVVCINAGDEPARLDLSLPSLEGRALDPVTWEGWPWGSGQTVLVDGVGAAVDLPARSARVLRAR